MGGDEAHGAEADEHGAENAEGGGEVELGARRGSDIAADSCLTVGTYPSRLRASARVARGAFHSVTWQALELIPAALFGSDDIGAPGFKTMSGMRPSRGARR
ncbi:MAG: hypothetical protein WDN31_17990 [Hyphomicrobium sp.]